jgi:hypothetical protein
MFGFHRYSFGSAASVNHLACLEETNFSDRVLALVPERSAYSSFIIAGSYTYQTKVTLSSSSCFIFFLHVDPQKNAPDIEAVRGGSDSSLLVGVPTTSSMS